MICGQSNGSHEPAFASASVAYGKSVERERIRLTPGHIGFSHSRVCLQSNNFMIYSFPLSSEIWV